MFAVEIGGYYNPVLRLVDLWAAGHRLTTVDNAAYVPFFARCMLGTADYLRSGRVPGAPFPGTPADQTHRQLHADDESDFREQFWIMHWGETVDNFAKYAWAEGENLVLTFQFYGDDEIFTVRMPAAELAATLDAAANLLISEHRAPS